MFDESDVKGVKDFTSRIVPKSICFRVRRVTDQHTGARALVDLRVVSLDQCKGAASDLAQVR